MLPARPVIAFALAISSILPFGCQNPKGGSKGGANTAATLAGQVWELAEIGGSPAPKGGGGRAVTLEFDATAKRAAGFGGCNQYGGSYTVDGDKLTFGAAVSTKMACADGMQVEGLWLRTLPLVRRYVLDGNELVLRSEGGVLARLRKR